MARIATQWAYGPKIAELHLETSELALLRALCFKAHPSTCKTDPITDRELAQLTGYARQTLTNARKRLKELKLIAFEHGNKINKEKYTKSTYLYFVRFTPEFE